MHARSCVIIATPIHAADIERVKAEERRIAENDPATAPFLDEDGDTSWRPVILLQADESNNRSKRSVQCANANADMLHFREVEFGNDELSDPKTSPKQLTFLLKLLYVDGSLPAALEVHQDDEIVVDLMELRDDNFDKQP